MITSPKDLRNLGLSELEHLAEDIRQKIIETCLKNGGHLGASLGPVEIAIALHRVFESPREPIIWDVGHQAYAHKLITGRWKQFSTLRQTGGISGFLSREESEHDVFGAGHSSTALSAALGFAAAQKPEGWTVAVVGDGSLTAGVSLEALNCFRAQQRGNVLVVLNDNQMSIAPNVGAIPAILASGETREFFAHFGFDYVGPLDGHSIPLLVGTLEAIKSQPTGRPILLHIHTQKGKGYAPAEERPAIYHGVGPIQPTSTKPAAAKLPSYSEAFGSALCRLAEKDDRIIAITAAMPEGTGLVEFAQKFPSRFFDVGIAEQHAVTFAAALAGAGLRPVVAIYSTFLQRSLDSIIHDTALQKLPVVFAIDRAGIVGADGPTHHGSFDLAYLAPIPGLTISAPTCLGDMHEMLEEAFTKKGPVAIRYPRGSGATSLPAVSNPANPKLIVVAVGSAAPRALAALGAGGPALSESAALHIVRQVKPIGPELIEEIDRRPDAELAIVEDGAVQGGFGQTLYSKLAPRKTRPMFFGYPDQFIPHGSPADLERMTGLDVGGLAESFQKLLSQSKFK